MHLSATIKGAPIIGVALCLLSGCTDVRDFAGSWSGKVVAEEAVRQGFSPEASVELLTLNDIDLQSMTATLTTDDGKFKGTPLVRIEKSASDALASLSFTGAPLRSYLLFAPLASELSSCPASMVISLFSDDHVELRIFRANELFGVFNLHRKEE